MKFLIISSLLFLGACTASNFDEYQHGTLSEIAVDVSKVKCKNSIFTKNTINLIYTKTQYLVVYSVGDKNIHKAVNQLRKLVGEMKSRYDIGEPSIAYCEQKLDLIIKSVSRILKGSRERQR